MKPIHLLSTLLTTLATITATVAAFASPSSSSSSSRYTSYLLSSPKSPIDLNHHTYNEITSKPRDYFVAILFTARDPKYGCTVCKAVQPEWDLLAGSWNKAAISLGQKNKKNKKNKKTSSDTIEEEDVPKVVWGTLDFANGRPIFEKMMLSSAPVLIVLPPTTGPHAKTDQTPFRYDFNSSV
ncbi:oligosaccharyl transferase subunit ost3/OST6 [Ascosphaera aggregata]|nr:oligosaccharyl transferase subunit ost3/OST6 [Ascosphaera aggregata]